MDVGIGLPATFPTTDCVDVAMWAERAEAGPFSSLGLNGTVIYRFRSAVTALTPAANATKRIRLVSTVLQAPIRSTRTLAKQASNLNTISAGRFTLGFVGVGPSEEVCLAYPDHADGVERRQDLKLKTMTQIWAENTANEGAHPGMPPPTREGGPGLLIGAVSRRAMARASNWAHGFIVNGGGGPEEAKTYFEAAQHSWRDAGRPGETRRVATAFFALDEDSRTTGLDVLTHRFGEKTGSNIAKGMPGSPQAIKNMIAAYEDVGCDELLLWPVITDINQVDRLGDIV